MPVLSRHPFSPPDAANWYDDGGEEEDDDAFSFKDDPNDPKAYNFLPKDLAFIANSLYNNRKKLDSFPNKAIYQIHGAVWDYLTNYNPTKEQKKKLNLLMRMLNTRLKRIPKDELEMYSDEENEKFYKEREEQDKNDPDFQEFLRQEELQKEEERQNRIQEDKNDTELEEQYWNSL